MYNNLRKIVYNYNAVGKILGSIITFFQFTLLSFYKDKNIINLIKSVKNEVDFAFYPFEAYMLYSIVRSQNKLKGEMAEVGVYQGGSSRIICEAKERQTLHLFDTFTGLTGVSDKDTHFGVKFWKDGKFSETSENNVKAYLSKYDDVYIHKGLFPETAEVVTHTKFSFVHLDVDLYKSTLNCLDFFYPRLIKGGIILTHDYHSNGVKSAFDEYFSNKITPIIELTGSQCIVIKID